ncbi:hypothetical protein [Saccharococcus sp. Marseille-Q5394]|uniref:hypothetical protein n=1 Tax=Saccharococcus sp. Marseille-Q5394 TaxID=2972778 RepID=UPI0021C8D934|nr:hypothetical protein [Saccharococcus sp. Marseille-Q5394]
MKKKRLMIVTLLSMLVLSACADKSETPEQSGTETVETTKSEDVAKIEGTTFAMKDMEFYSLMQVIDMELTKARKAENLEGKALEQSNAYWDEEIARFENPNIQLQKLIEIHAMSLIGKEKHYYIHPDKLERKIADFKDAIAGNAEIQAMLKEFGKDEVNGRLHVYFEKVMLVDRIVTEIEKNIRAEIPEASNQEIAYEVSKRYEELYMDQVSGLEREIYLR